MSIRRLRGAVLPPRQRPAPWSVCPGTKRSADDLERGQPCAAALDTVGSDSRTPASAPPRVQSRESRECRSRRVCRQPLRLELLVRQQSPGEPLQGEPVQGSQHQRPLALARPEGRRASPGLSGMSRPGPARRRATRWPTRKATSRPTDDEDVRDLLGDSTPSPAQPVPLARTSSGGPARPRVESSRGGGEGAAARRRRPGRGGRGSQGSCAEHSRIACTATGKLTDAAPVARLRSRQPQTACSAR